MEQARLITIPFSHYCEKARWALDATGMPYREDGYAPVAHRRATRAVGGQTVPVFVDGHRVLVDSTEIAIHADGAAPPERRLLPPGATERSRVLALEEELDETLGPDARLLIYWHALTHPPSARSLVERGFGLRSAVAQRVAVTAFRALIFRKYGVNRETAVRAEARVRQTFERMSAVLASSRYLVGDAFTLADLTLAALASPLLGPPEHPILGKAMANPPPAVAALRAELAATPAGRHALRVYGDHRKNGR